MKQAPQWLPYRVRQWIDQRRIDGALAGLEALRPLRAASPEEADAEVHMLLCRRDLRIGLAALYSLLRFDGARWAVTLTNDGSLAPKECQWVDARVPGCRWLPRTVRDEAMTAALAQRPHLAALYASDFVLAAKLLHPIVLARSPRVIQLDTDTAFLQAPTTLIEFARGRGPRAHYLHDHQDEATAVGAEARQAFAELQGVLAPEGKRSWGLVHYLFNAGLVAFQPRDLDLDVAERFLQWQAQTPASYRQGKLGIWFGAWTREQTSYMAMLALLADRPQPLGDDYHIGAAPGKVFNHFLRHYLVKQATLERLRALVREMKE